MDHQPTFRIKLKNAPDRGDLVGLDALGTAATAWNELLSLLAESPEAEIRWAVRNVRIGSIDIETEPVVNMAAPDVEPLDAEFWRDLGDHLGQSLNRIESGDRPDDVFEAPVARCVYQLISVLQHDGVNEIEIEADSTVVVLTWSGAGQHAKHAIRERSIGSITGSITSFSVNRRLPQFGLRLPTGELVPCTFNRDHMREVLANVEERVTVFGTLLRDGEGNVLRVLDVWEIISLPREELLPTMAQIAGTEPELGGGFEADEWVRLVRGEG